MVQTSTCNAGDPDSIPGLGRSLGEGNGNPLQYSLPGKFQRQWSLASYSPQGCKELDIYTNCIYHYMPILISQFNLSPFPRTV